MPAYKDKRNGKVYWRYRKWIKLLDGKRVRIKGKGALNTKESAEQAEHDHVERLLHPEKALARAALAESLAPKPRGLTIGKLIDLHVKGGTFGGIDYKPHTSGSKNADHSRAQILETFVRPRFEAMLPHDIKQGHIDAFRDAMAAMPGKRKDTLAADQTVRNKCFALTGLIEWAVEKHLIAPLERALTVTVTPTKEIRPVNDPEVIPVSASDVNELLACAGEARYRAAILLAADCGLRIGEIIGAEWRDIEDGCIEIVRSISARNIVGPPKGKITRTVPLSTRTRKELAGMSRGLAKIVMPSETDKRSRNNKRVLRTHLTYSALNKAIKAIYKRAHIPFGWNGRRTVNVWHSLRHTYGTQLVARGANGEDIQRLMGHKKYETTQRYIDRTKKQLKETVRKAFG